MKYKSIEVSAHGGPETLQIVDKDLREPAPGEALIRILASPVVQDDIAVRVGNRPWLKEIPFTPGYSIIGDIEALGEGVSSVAQGDRVVALVNYGGHAEYIYWPADQLVPAPKSLDPAEAVTLILNYLVAYQTLHRIAKVQTGEKILIIGASGGVGSAYLQLGKAAGLKMYGLASPGKHGILLEHGAIPIDYRSQDFVLVIREAEPGGLDYVFNGMAGEYLSRGLAVLRRGGMLVHYGAPESMSDFIKFIVLYLYYNLLPNGKKIVGYGTHRLGVDLFEPDWNTLFKMLADGQIKPVIEEKFPLLEAARANELLESGKVSGNIVLLAPELLPKKDSA